VALAEEKHSSLAEEKHSHPIHQNNRRLQREELHNQELPLLQLYEFGVLVWEAYLALPDVDAHRTQAVARSERVYQMLETRLKAKSSKIRQLLSCVWNAVAGVSGRYFSYIFLANGIRSLVFDGLILSRYVADDANCGVQNTTAPVNFGLQPWGVAFLVFSSFGAGFFLFCILRLWTWHGPTMAARTLRYRWISAIFKDVPCVTLLMVCFFNVVGVGKITLAAFIFNGLTAFRYLRNEFWIAVWEHVPWHTVRKLLGCMRAAMQVWLFIALYVTLRNIFNVRHQVGFAVQSISIAATSFQPCGRSSVAGSSIREPASRTELSVVTSDWDISVFQATSRGSSQEALTGSFLDPALNATVFYDLTAIATFGNDLLDQFTNKAQGHFNSIQFDGAITLVPTNGSTLNDTVTLTFFQRDTYDSFDNNLGYGEACGGAALITAPSTCSASGFCWHNSDYRLFFKDVVRVYSVVGQMNQILCPI